MDNLLAARIQMGMSLAFHIIFACVGIAMPLLMVLAEICWRRTGDDTYLHLAKRWAKGTAVFFAVGAVSGTVLSFELGLLWPHFMAYAGSIIGMPFSLEGFAFFTEAIFLGIYLYGWKKITPWQHIAAGGVVAASGAASALFVILANGWMNTPTGFRDVNGVAVDIDPIAAMLNPSGIPESIHMLAAAYAATAFAVAGIHAFVLHKNPANALHQRALALALGLAAVSGFLVPLTGDGVAQAVAHNQPEKLAALEGQFETERGAPLRIGGIPDENARVTRFAIDIPYGLSLLAFHDINAEIKGLNAFPRENWPPVLPVHLCFQAMVACGGAMGLLSAWVAFVFFRKQPLHDNKWLLKAAILASPLGMIAVECGWMVTEIGRQPWVIHAVMRTADAVTPAPSLVPCILFSLLYLFLGSIVVRLLFNEVKASETLFHPPQARKTGWLQKPK
jgi:cytochrome d ubiquinol oxidase subunit I